MREGDGYRLGRVLINAQIAAPALLPVSYIVGCLLGWWRRWQKIA
jgi:hypothetical protein